MRTMIKLIKLIKLIKFNHSLSVNHSPRFAGEAGKNHSSRQL